MCYQRHKTPVYYPKCVGKATGNCTRHDPDGDFVDWCDPAKERGRQCEPPRRSRVMEMLVLEPSTEAEVEVGYW